MARRALRPHRRVGLLSGAGPDLRCDGTLLRTPQIPSTGRCIEELLAAGIRTESRLEQELLSDLSGAEPAVLAVHAEIEGGPYAASLERLLELLRRAGWTFRTLAHVARALALDALPVCELAHVELPGRSGRVATSAEPTSSPTTART